MFKFIHAADFHLDSAFGALSARQAAERRRESRLLPDRLADYVLTHGIDAVLLPGDLFDGENVYRETVEELARALEKMQALVFIAPGNHDYYGSDSPWTQTNWPDNVTIFDHDRMEAVEVPVWNAVFHGAAFTGPERQEGFLRNFAAPQDGRIHIGVLHGDVEGGRYAPVSRADIAGSNLSYLALGHIHKRSEPEKLGGTLYAWSGCIEGRGFDELGEKGFYEGAVSDDGTVSVKFVPFARHRYESLEVNITDREPLAVLEAVLPANTRCDLYRITLTGEMGEQGVDLTGLTERLEERFYALELRDHTRLRQELWQRAGEDSLRGLFLQNLLHRRAAAETEKEREVIDRAARYGLAALDHRDLG